MSDDTFYEIGDIILPKKMCAKVNEDETGAKCIGD